MMMICPEWEKGRRKKKREFKMHDIVWQVGYKKIFFLNFFHNGWLKKDHWVKFLVKIIFL